MMMSARLARKLFDKAEQILITDIVLVETIWTLKGKRYQASKADIVAVVQGLFDRQHITADFSCRHRMERRPCTISI